MLFFSVLRPKSGEYGTPPLQNVGEYTYSRNPVCYAYDNYNGNVTKYVSQKCKKISDLLLYIRIRCVLSTYKYTKTRFWRGRGFAPDATAYDAPHMPLVV